MPSGSSIPGMSAWDWARQKSQLVITSNMKNRRCFIVLTVCVDIFAHSWRRQTSDGHGSVFWWISKVTRRLAALAQNRTVHGLHFLLLEPLSAVFVYSCSPDNQKHVRQSGSDITGGLID